LNVIVLDQNDGVWCGGYGCLLVWNGGDVHADTLTFKSVYSKSEGLC